MHPHPNHFSYDQCRLLLRSVRGRLRSLLHEFKCTDVTVSLFVGVSGRAVSDRPHRTPHAKLLSGANAGTKAQAPSLKLGPLRSVHSCWAPVNPPQAPLSSHMGRTGIATPAALVHVHVSRAADARVLNVVGSIGPVAAHHAPRLFHVRHDSVLRTDRTTSESS